MRAGPAGGSSALEVDVYTASALATAETLAGVSLAPQGGGPALDPPLGVVRVDARDCADVAASGVTIAIASQDGPVVAR